MSARETIMAKVRAALAGGAAEEARKRAVAERLKKAPAGVIPARGQLPQAERVELFSAQAEKVYATVQRLRKQDDVPKAVAEYLRDRNLPAAVRMGYDKRLMAMSWAQQRHMEVKYGASDGDDLAGVSFAAGAVAETGTLVMTSGPNNPTTINFLPEHHIVVVDATDIEGDLETALARMRKTAGKAGMPRTVNLITGPSKSGDIEQKIVLGAHGPRALHLIVVG